MTLLSAGSCGHQLFGQNCSSSCHCFNDTDCDKSNGICPARGVCEDGWKTDQCDEECGNQRFGKNCSEACHCDECHHINGSCSLFSKQCYPGFQGDSCSEELKQTKSPVGGIVGGIMAFLVAAGAVAGGVFFIIRRRKLNKDNPAKDFSNKLPARSNRGKPDALEMRNNASNNPMYSNNG
ncbi:multiple epidermal growth factor-like domains protein 10 [Mya arenaria]|uniref:multiple epidermal growth factor-like domains protein 10 n=1 Tax=Mya arenaria TaxID=6604 RepID=UPI0022E8CFEE|nr:multiple epidermal growth factor-like domains protein 10 [Mya arenaria]